MSKLESFFLEGKNNLGVLLCHTLAGSPDEMRELGKKLNKKGYTVSCPLYSGHDKDFDHLITTQVTDWYKDVVKAYDELSEKVDGVYVVGMSIGGTFTVKLAQQKDLKGIVTINAPIIGFDIENDVFQFQSTGRNMDQVKIYRLHRAIYFDFVTKLGQIENIKKITCPIFTLQGSLDTERYKTSTMMLNFYSESEVKQRRDYPRSRHLVLLEGDKKQAVKDIIEFIENN